MTGLLALLAGEIAAFYGSDPLACPDYGRIVNEKHFHRLMGLMDSGRVVCGGTGQRRNAADCAHGAGGRFTRQPGDERGNFRARPSRAGL